MILRLMEKIWVMHTTNLLTTQHTRKSWSLPIPLALLSLPQKVTIYNMPMIELFSVHKHLHKMLWIHFSSLQIPFFKNKKDAYFDDCQ